MTDTEREILSIERQQETDFNNRDIKALVSQFGQDFVGFSSTQHSRIVGLAALQKTFQHYLRQSPRLRYRITQPRVQVLEGVAVATFYWTVELSARRRVQGRGTHVYANRGGQWQIVHEHFSRSH